MEIYRGTRLRIEKVLHTLPDGTRRERIVVRPGPAVAILPIDGEFCYLIRQYRFPLDAWIYEVPAGTIDGREEPEETARRELIEETGLSAGKLTPHGKIFTTPGYTDEVIYLFEARDLSPSSDFEKDEDEKIELVKLHQSELTSMIQKGTIRDAKTICLACLCLGRGILHPG
ncbi:MAG: NUDIX hydrolase [Methanomicrobiaceae archaeon]|nr:NUDIX hydrolase [Methanomicrobiaceae archaeon]